MAEEHDGQAAAARVLAALVRQGRKAGLRPLSWTVNDTPGASLTGRAHCTRTGDGPAVRRALGAWAGLLGAGVTAHPHGDGMVTLTGEAERKDRGRPCKVILTAYVPGPPGEDDDEH